MLIYEKKVLGERHLFGTLGNIPQNSDGQLVYRDAEGAVESPTLNDTYLDNGHGGIIQKSTGKTVNVFIGDTAVIPQNLVKTLTDISAVPIKTTYSVNDTLASVTVYPFYNTGIGTTPLESSDYTVDPAVGSTLDSAGEVTVTVTGADDTDYEGMTDTFKVTVS